MNKAPLLFLLLAGETFAHAGHGAPLVHSHGWDGLTIAFWLVVVGVAAAAAWGAK